MPEIATCTDILALLCAQQERTLGLQEIAAMQAHCAQCVRCRQLQHAYSNVVTLLSGYRGIDAGRLPDVDSVLVAATEKKRESNPESDT